MTSTTPAGLDIQPRQPDFDLPSPLPRHWHSGDAFKTHLFNAMSVLFPDGERFFIHSVRLFREQISDPTLLQQIRGFIGQEGHHSHEHQAYNQALGELGYDISGIERSLKRRLAFAKKYLPNAAQLATTCAVEHFTAIMADALLKDPRWLEGADPRMARLWRWHALEETEHKAVAFDVYQQVCGSRWLLRRSMIQSTIFFTWDTTKGLVVMLKRDGLLWNWRVWRDGLRWLWGKEGIYRQLIPVYLDFYRRDFHPWQHDNLELVNRYKGDYEPQSSPAA